MAEGILAQEKGETMLVATGSMTNMALLVSLYPEVVEWVKGVVIMGGAVKVGNVTPVAEFNIWVCIYVILTKNSVIQKRQRHYFRFQNSQRNWLWCRWI
jgi:hypothetical protein